MFKGIISLFTSGAIFNPMVLLGIFVGIVLYMVFPYAYIFNIYADYTIYTFSLLIAFIYVYFFVPRYRGKTIDYSDVAISVFGSFLKLILSSFLMISFVSLFSF